MAQWALLLISGCWLMADGGGDAPHGGFSSMRQIVAEIPGHLHDAEASQGRPSRSPLLPNIAQNPEDDPASTRHRLKEMRGCAMGSHRYDHGVDCFGGARSMACGRTTSRILVGRLNGGGKRSDEARRQEPSAYRRVSSSHRVENPVGKVPHSPASLSSSGHSPPRNGHDREGVEEALLDAASSGHYWAIPSLARGVSVECRNGEGLTPLMMGALRGYSKTVDRLIQLHANVSARDARGRTALHLAAEAGHTNTVECLLHFGSNASLQDDFGHTPLHLALMCRQRYAADKLIAHGANISAVDKQGISCLELARQAKIEVDDPKEGEDKTEGVETADESTFSTVGISREEHADPLPLVNHSESILEDDLSLWEWLKAVSQEDVELAKEFVSRKKNVVEWVDNRGRTAMHYAVHSGNNKMIRLLYKNGAKIDSRDDFGRCPIHVAASHGKFWVIRRLFKHGTEIDLVDHDNRTALMFAAWQGCEETIKCLIGLGANVNARDRFNCSAVHFAAYRGYNRTLSLLLKFVEDVDARDEQQGTSLHKAVMNGHTSVVKLLLEAGADVNAVDASDCSALHFAASRGNEQMMETLLAAGADVKACDRSGKTALHWSAGNGHLGCSQALVKAGGDVLARDVFNATALHLACEFGHTQLVDFLLWSGADANGRDYFGNSALHFAARKGQGHILELLIRAGSDPMSKDAAGWSPMHWAHSGGHKEVVSTLSALGCSFLHEPARAEMLVEVDDVGREVQGEFTKHPSYEEKLESFFSGLNFSSFNTTGTWDQQDDRGQDDLTQQPPWGDRAIPGVPHWLEGGNAPAWLDTEEDTSLLPFGADADSQPASWCAQEGGGNMNKLMSLFQDSDGY